MTDAQLNDKIRDHLEVVMQYKPGDLAAAISELDVLRDSVSGHLGHYLAKRSYAKAYTLLQGEDPEKGACS